MSVSNQRVRADRGFTLIEILIAITILSFITIGVVTITENSMNTKDRTSQLNADNLQIETAMSRFEWDFLQIYSPLYFSSIMNFNQNMNTAGAANGAANAGSGSGEESEEGSGFANASAQSGSGSGANFNQNPALAAYQEALAIRMQTNEHFMNISKEGMPIPRFYSPEKNIFEFFTSSNRRKIENTKQSHFGWVRYTMGDPIERDADSGPDTEPVNAIPKGLKTLVRYYTADDPYNPKRINPDSAADSQVKGAVLLENVEKLEFSFWNFQTRKWESSLKAIANGESVIHGVRVQLAWYDSMGIKRTTDRIFRTHWPLVVPQDPVATGGAAAGAAGANPAGPDGILGTEDDVQAGTTANGTTGAEEGDP